MVTSDGGTTWNVRGEVWAFRSVAFADAQHGVASRSHFAAGAGGLYYTSDGGLTWNLTYEFPDESFKQYVALRYFTPNSVRAILPYRYQNFLDWKRLSSHDAGATWTTYNGIAARRPLMGGIFWQDSTDIHVVSDGAIIQHSADGGELFYLLRDTTAGYWQSDIDNIFPTKVPVSASDNAYLYIAGPNGLAARWRVAPPQPFSAVRVDGESSGARITSVRAGVIDVELTVPTATRVSIDVVDVLGSVRCTIPAAQLTQGTQRLSVPTTGLSAGRYYVVIRTGRGVQALPATVGF
jgi:hypothetical protein